MASRIQIARERARLGPIKESLATAEEDSRSMREKVQRLVVQLAESKTMSERGVFHLIKLTESTGFIVSYIFLIFHVDLMTQSAKRPPSLLLPTLMRRLRELEWTAYRMTWWGTLEPLKTLTNTTLFTCTWYLAPHPFALCLAVDPIRRCFACNTAYETPPKPELMCLKSGFNSITHTRLTYVFFLLLLLF